MKNTIKKIRFILVVLLVASCASNIKTEKTTDDNLREYKTFAYLPNTTFEVNEFNEDYDDSVESSLVTTLNNEMAKKGYSINYENPDLLLLLNTNRELNSNEIAKSKYERSSSGGSTGSSPNFAATGSSGGKRYGSNNESETSNIPSKKGSLAVEIYNRKTKELIWTGRAENVKTHISDQTLMQRILTEIFKKFPK